MTCLPKSKTARKNRRSAAITGLCAVLCPVVAEDIPNSPNTATKEIRRIQIEAKQGVAVDQTYFYAISNTRISKGDKQSGKIIATWQPDESSDRDKHFKHLNSGTVIDGKLYCAHSRYAVDPNANTVEIWDVEDRKLVHEKSIPMPRKHGSLTWIDRRADGSWWMCYAVYGKGKNSETRFVKYRYEGQKFIEEKNWTFPEGVINKWGKMSCSGGAWGPDGYLYTTGHDHPEAYVLEIAEGSVLKYVRTEKNLGFFGQAIAWDRTSEKPVLWGIVKNKYISVNRIPEKAGGK